MTGHLGITMDLSATFAATFAGAKPADDRPFDGINLIPILTGEQPAKDRTLYWRINRETRQQKALRHGKWKYIQDSNVEMLFDLGTDVGERRDLSFQHPDIFAGLKRELAGWEAEMARVKTDPREVTFRVRRKTGPLRRRGSADCAPRVCLSVLTVWPRCASRASHINSRRRSHQAVRNCRSRRRAARRPG